MNDPRPRRPGQAGFTLLEILVALAGLGFLLVDLTQGVRFGLTAWTLQSRGIAARDEVGAAERLLRGLVERMEPGSEDEPSVLRGLPGALQFRTTLPPSANVLGFRVVDAAIGVEAGGRLVLRLVPNPRATRTGSAMRAIEETLISGIERAEIAYWRLPRRNTNGEWVRNWSATEQPGMIRIRIIFPPGDSRHWPDIVMTPLRDPLER
jgi:general secretion pathway protein J